MATITLKEVPSSLHERLKERARQHGRSLNREIIESLNSLVLARPAKPDQLLDRIRGQRRGLPGSLTRRLIDEARKGGRP